MLKEDGETSTRLPEIKQDPVHANQSVCVIDINNAALVDDALQFPTGKTRSGVLRERMQRTPRLLDEQFEQLVIR
jgi:hypothetical protein